MQSAAFNLEVRNWLRAVLVGTCMTVGTALLAGDKIIFDQAPRKSDLPDADARKNLGYDRFDQLDRRSSVSGVAGIPEIPYTLMPRSKKQMDQLERQKNFLLSKPEEPGGQLLTPEEALGVREAEWSTDQGKPRARNSFEQYIVGEEGPVSKKKQDPGLEEIRVSTDRFVFDPQKSQMGSLGGLSFGKERKGAAQQGDQPDLFGGTMAASPFSSLSTVREKERVQKSRDDFARLLDPKAETGRKELKGWNALMRTPGEGSSIEPIAAFGVDPTRREMSPTNPLLPNPRGADDLAQRREDLMTPFPQLNKARGALSFGTIDPGGSRLLNFNSGANLGPAVIAPTVTPRPGVLEFPSRKF